MSKWPFPEHLTESELASEAPELALLQLRRGIEERLAWLEARLAPTASAAKPGLALVDQGLIERATFEAIAELLQSTNAEEYGDKVTPSAASIVLRAGIALAEELDNLIELTEHKAERLPPQKRLVYAYLGLLWSAKLEIARELGIKIPSKVDASTRADLARHTFGAATDAEKRRKLWNLVALETDAIRDVDNPYSG